MYHILILVQNDQESQDHFQKCFSKFSLRRIGNGQGHTVAYQADSADKKGLVNLGMTIFAHTDSIIENAIGWQDDEPQEQSFQQKEVNG